MRNYIIIILTIIIFLFISACSAKDSTTNFFNIDVGDKPDELGVILGQGEVRDIGPISLAIYNDNIYILDRVNLRVNIYTIDGKFLKNIPLSENLSYYDLSVSSEDKIMLLTNDGIYFRDETMEKLYDLPTDIRVPYYISNLNPKLGNIVFSGLSKKGRFKIGVIDKEGSYKYLNGFRIISNNSGLVGVQISNNNIDVYRDEKKVSSIKILENMLPIGLTDKSTIFCVQPRSEGFNICLVRNNEVVSEKEIKYNKLLIQDEINIMKFFKVTDKGKIVILETSQNQIKVSIISF